MRPTTIEELLRYLGEVGYGETYRRPPGQGVTSASPPASSSRAGSPASSFRDEPEGEVPDLAALAAEAATCTRCRLAETRKTVVFGSGDPHAELMLIGEGPGAEEDRRGLPFVGPAGELLTRILRAIGLGREQVYIANIVKCRPPGNRDPQPDEAESCRPYLEGQIAAIRPRVIVALGRVAAQALLGNDLPLGRLRGQWYSLYGADLMVTYHPAAILRNEALKRPTWDDMQKVRDRLQERAG